ncbi:Uncharacterised protein [Weissella viridescens]|uniref:Uncharacterized protein n=1 Tax=Weissella viridescens TaxID=1629 RepID=A0A380P9N2_WEIVI|nr:Uncharacterised protein [Weissella viridescens]
MALSKPQKAKDESKEATVHPIQVQPISESGVVKARHQQEISVPEGAKVNLYVNDGANVSAGDVWESQQISRIWRRQRIKLANYRRKLRTHNKG